MAFEDHVTEVDIVDDGILWMLNSTVFHPRGLALMINTETQRLAVIGDATEVVVFSEETAEEGKAKFDAFISRHMAQSAEVEK